MGAWAGVTYRGSVRPTHQDAFLAGDDLVSASSLEGRRRSFPIFPPVVAVCDGMGGHEHGELASRNTLTMLQDVCLLWEPRSTSLRDVERGIRSIHSKLFQMGQGRPLPMGTTLSGIFLRRSTRTCFVFHAGDSRVYRVRSGIVEQLTEDHNRAYELGSGTVGKNVLTSCIGGGLSHPRIDVFETAVDSNDVFVLISDGMIEGRDESEWTGDLSVLGERDAVLVDRLVDMVHDALNVSRDNLTIVAVRFDTE